MLVNLYQSWDLNSLTVYDLLLSKLMASFLSRAWKWNIVARESYSNCLRSWEMERHWCTGMVPAMLGQLMGSIFLKIWCMLSSDSCSITWPVKMLAQGEESPEGYLGILAVKFVEGSYCICSCICLVHAYLYSHTHPRTWPYTWQPRAWTRHDKLDEYVINMY